MSTAAMTAAPGMSGYTVSQWTAPPPCLRDRTMDEQELLNRYHEHGDLSARQELVEQMLPLVRTLAGVTSTGGNRSRT